MYATLQLKGTKRRKKGSSTNLNDFQVGDSSSVIFFSSEESSWLWIDRQTKLIFVNFLGARNFIGLVGFGALDVDQLVYSPGKIQGAVPLSRLPRSLFLLGSSGLSELWQSGIAGSNTITEIYLRLSPLSFFETAKFVILWDCLCHCAQGKLFRREGG